MNSSRPSNNAGAAYRRPQNRSAAHQHSEHRHNEHRNHNHHPHREHERHSHSHNHHERHEHHNHSHHSHENHNEHNEHKHESPKKNKNPILGFIPTSVYNPEDGKILGFLTAEDLLLIAMILMFLDSEEEGDNLMVYALLYVLASEWVDIGDFFKFLK